MKILPRSAWTTLPNRWATIGEGRLDPPRVNTLILHWPGDGIRSFAGRTQAQVAARIAGYDQYHREDNGWAGIGYCYVIDHDGRVWEAAGEYVAAHTRGLNREGIGVLLLVGTDDEVPPRMRAALDDLRAHLRRKGYPLGRTIGHRDAPGASTACPGPAVLAYLSGKEPASMATPYFVSPAQGYVSSNYGWRTHPITRKRNFHRGLDIANKIGTPVYAAYGGTVRYVRTNSNRGDKRGNAVTGTWNTGNIIVIDGPGGGSELYGHLDKVFVKKGQKVKAGQQIGTMGATGNVTGPHLHFETWNGRSQGGGTGAGNTRDPRADFRKHGVKVGSKPAATTKAPAPAKPKAKAKGDPEVLRWQKVLKNLGYYKGALDGVAGPVWRSGVHAYIKAQRYAPGLKADGVFGPAAKAHYNWTVLLQRTMKQWKGNRDTAIDGDFGPATAARVREIQRRNLGGVYKGALDGIPGPVFCRMLGIRKHPGA